MEQHFERDKNLKASAVTIGVCASIFLLFFFVSWTVPEIAKPEPMEGIEVNLGNSDMGSGDEQPLVQGTPGPTSSNDDNTPPTSGANSSAPDKTETDNDPDAPPVVTPTKTPVIKPNPAPVKKAVVAPTPAPPTPKAVQTKSKYEGGNGNGGNSDTYNKSTSQGNDPNGTKGDKGKPNGTVDGKGYTGTGGNGNVRIKGDRKMMYYPTYITDVQPGTVVVSVKVSPEGTGVFIDFLQGQFLAAYKNEVIKYLRGVKFNKADHESMIEMTFVFKR